MLTAVSVSSLSRADGDQAHGLTYRKSATGLGIATAGVGLSARRSISADVPLTAAELVLDDIPAGASVEVAYLYWVTYGAGDASVTLEGNALSGALIGSSFDTCWSEPWSTGALNRVTART